MGQGTSSCCWPALADETPVWCVMCVCVCVCVCVWFVMCVKHLPFKMCVRLKIKIKSI